MDPPTKPPAKKRKISTAQGTPSFDSHRFLSEDHQQWYGVVENRNLLPERKVVLQTGEHEEFQQELQRRKWIKLTRYAAPANVAIVKEFYANAMLFKAGVPTFKSFVRGKEISYSGRAINRFLGTELNLGSSGCQYVEWCNKKKDYLKVVEKLCKPGGDYVTSTTGHKRRILRGDLLPLAQIWMCFLHSNISPCSHTSDITERRSQMVYAIMAGLSMDIGAVIAEEIHLTANSGSTGQLSHPSLITELCRRAGVDVSEPPFQKPRQPINAQFILKNCMGSETRAPSVRVAPPPVPGSIPHRLGVLEADQQLINQKLDALYRSQVLMMSSIRSLSLQIPGISQDSFHFPSAEEVDSLVAWPKHPEKQDDIEGTGEHAVEKEGDEPVESEGVRMLMMLRKKGMSSLETRTNKREGPTNNKRRSTSEEGENHRLQHLMTSTNDNMEGGMTFKWTNEYEKNFCELCIKFITKNGRVPFKWTEINKEFETIINRKCSDKTLKNKFEAMKKDWRTWRFLKFGETGIGWDPVTGKLDCSEEWWCRKVKENRDAENFRNKSVDSTLEELWNQIFEDNYATGANIVATSMVSDFVQPVECVNIDVDEGDKESGEEDNQDSEGDRDDVDSEYNRYASEVDHLLSEEWLFWHESDNTRVPSQGLDGTQIHSQDLRGSQEPTQGIGCTQIPSQGGGTSKTTQTQKATNKSSKGKLRRRQSGGAPTLSAQIDALVSNSETALQIMRSNGSVSKDINAKSSIVAAIGVIDRIVTECGLEKGSERWCFAYCLIENEVRREIFLNMEDDVSRKAWLMYMHAKEN